MVFHQSALFFRSLLLPHSSIEDFILSLVLYMLLSQEPVLSVVELSQLVKDFTSAVSSIQRQQERLLQVNSFLASQTGLQSSQAQSSMTEREGLFHDLLLGCHLVFEGFVYL